MASPPRTVFRTVEGRVVPAVTADEMREVDRIAVQEFGLGILQMMENAGRALAHHVMELLRAADGRPSGEVVVLAGSGGNGGGGLCCARHLHNRGWTVSIVLDRNPDALTGAAVQQQRILRAAGLEPVSPAAAAQAIAGAALVVDALIGYGLRDAPQGRTAELIDFCAWSQARVLSLDVPSGLNATTGEAPGAVVRPQRTLTLALPKAGLRGAPGELYLADIGIPPAVFHLVGFSYGSPFGALDWVRLSGQGP